MPEARSIGRELLLGLLVVVAATWVATLAISYFDARHELDELLDAHLAQSASMLLARTEGDAAELGVEHLPQLHRYARSVAFQLWERGEVLKLHSLNAPSTRLSARLEGFADVDLDGHRWRAFSAWDPSRRYLVQVAERREARDEIVANIVEHLAWPLLVALPLLGLLIWLAIRRTLQPLRLLRRQIEERAPDSLTAIDAGRAPVEVVPLIESLNQLFRRVGALRENERRFTADAAHELRTPLAALRAQAQVARGASDDAERARALGNVIAGADRAAHLVDQLLTLARLEPEGFRAERARCDLVELCKQALGEAANGAMEKAVELELIADAPAGIRGDPLLLRVVLRNLLDNAVRYSPKGTVVRVTVSDAGPGPRLRVADEGPGVTEEELAQLGRRFHRLLGTEETGTGLGLSIVKRIAELHGASLMFDRAGPAGGLAVTLRFPGDDRSPRR